MDELSAFVLSVSAAFVKGVPTWHFVDKVNASAAMRPFHADFIVTLRIHRQRAIFATVLV